jgi:large subunit ribosomal protein L33
VPAPSPRSRRNEGEEAAMRDNITLECSTCKRRNYTSSKNKKKTTGKLEFRKFCSHCRQHTAHKETK